MKILFVNSCVRPQSRTYRLCREFLNTFCGDMEIQEIDLQFERLAPLDYITMCQRDADSDSGNFAYEHYRYAKDFAAADLILIGAPYWDNSFPASLKVYFEHVSMGGITFTYGDTGEMIGLCKAKKLFYIATSGGYIGSRNSGEAYIRDMCDMFGIKEMQTFTAEGLDINTNDPEKIMEDAVKRLKALNIAL